MKKSSKRKSQQRQQQRRQSADRRRAAASTPVAASGRAHPRMGHAGRVSAARSGSPRTAGRAAFFLAAARRWQLPAVALAGRSTLDASLARLARPAGAISLSLPREDREALTLLLTPILVLAAAIAMSLGLQLERSMRQVIAEAPPAVSRPAKTAPQRVTLRPVAAVPSASLPTPALVSALPPAAPSAAPSVAGVNVPVIADAPSVAGSPPATVPRVGGIATPASTVPDARRVEPALASAAADAVAGTAVPAPMAAPPLRVAEVRSAAPGILEIASLDPSRQPSLGVREDERMPGPLAGAAAPLDDPRCVAAVAADRNAAALPSMPTGPSAGGDSFGFRLAQAARAQLGEFVIYNDAYRRLSYPMGDVPKLYGVCTDVVIRAYRALGVDLQVAVQRARVGAGDTSIDHRRTETLRRFFARAGQNLPVTSYAEDYQPGDIVTYDRPQNSGSRSHIAVVSDVMSPTGRPMIIHNRGWGPQLEDGLFVDRITGHYRFDGQMRSPMPAAPVVAARNGTLAAPIAAVSARAPAVRPATLRALPPRTSAPRRPMRSASIGDKPAAAAASAQR